MNRFANVMLGLGALCVVGCGNSGTSGDDAGTTAADDAATTTALCDRVPTSGFGTRVGAYQSPFALPGGWTTDSLTCPVNDYSFYNEDFCADDHRVTVLSIAAEWCSPCQMETAEMTEQLVEAYAGRGVRVIQVMYQNADYGAPDLDLCDRWVDRFDLSGQVEVIDPEGLVGASFPTGSLPSTLIIDRNGRIVERHDGYETGLGTIRAAIDAELAR